MLIARLNRGVLEKLKGLYKNLWFLVTKKLARTYRLINIVIKINAVTLRDINIPPSIDKFSKKFTGYIYISLVDFFSRYN